MSDVRFDSCTACAGVIGWIECPTGGWWAHQDHPTDHHDAVPARADGWVRYGTHANREPCDYTGSLEFSGDEEDGLPGWERHEACKATYPTDGGTTDA